MSKSKKRSINTQQKPKKKSIKKRTAITLTVAAVFATAAVALLIFRSVTQSAKLSQFTDVSWVCTSAYNASGDEVELSEIYNTNYSSYKGSLNFRDDGTFSLWLSPGSPDDGTHVGNYRIESDAEIKVTFSGGYECSFDVNRKNGEITSIVVQYNDNYEVYFTRK